MRTVAILDTETTGLDPTVDRVVELAVILYDLKLASVIRSASWLISIGDDADVGKTTETTGITVELVRANGQGEGDGGVWEIANRACFEAEAFVAHNASFDKSFCAPKGGRFDSTPWVCSMTAVEWPCGSRGTTLAALALSHGVAVTSAHRAMADCETLARLLTAVAARGVDLEELIGRAAERKTRRVAAIVSYAQKDLAKQAGFKWSGTAWVGEFTDEEIAKFKFKVRPA